MGSYDHRDMSCYDNHNRVQANRIAVHVIATFESHFYCYTYKYYQTITTPTTPFPPYIREKDHPLSYSYIQTEIPWASWDMGFIKLLLQYTPPLFSLSWAWFSMGSKSRG